MDHARGAQLSPLSDDLPPSDIKLDVGVIGAGIAGLAAAIALTDAGHDVEIFEKSRFANEIGAGIHMPPNSSRILLHYGFDSKAAKGAEANENAEVQKTWQYPDCREKYGAPWLLFHRSDLHNELKRLALEPGEGRRHSAKLRLQSRVTDVDEEGTIHLASGDVTRKDLVVIANGIHTDLIEKVTMQSVKIEPAGRAMIRFLIPMDKVARDPRTKALYEAGLGRFLYCIKGERNFISYPCRSGTMANCGIIYPDNVDWQDDWSLPATKDDLSKALEGYAEMFQALAEMADDLSIWRLAIRDEPVQTLTRGRLVLSGDALHPMLPFLGQGAAMAVEDAAALGVLMGSLNSAEEVSERLQLYQDLRVDRVCAVQTFSSWGTLGIDTVIERSKPFFHETKCPESHLEINEYCYKVDTMRDATAMLQQHLKRGSKAH